MPSRKDLANAIRFLSMDAVEKAKSGHPGAPMGMADMAEVLWNDFLKHNPANPAWCDRDRFVLSNGHASMLLYSLLHLSGYNLSIEDIKNFRQLHSKTAGHPEYGLTPGVETTTGPLGQGFATAVGMALAERKLAQEFNREGFDIVDHHTYVFLGDGCMMEGLSHEAASLAGALKLGKLIAFWDDNGISIDGPVAGWFTDDTPARFKAYGWQVISGVDGHDGAAVKKAIAKAKRETGKPSLICCRTTIAYGAPGKSGSAKSHGAPLGEEEINAARKLLGWSHPPFVIPSEIKNAWDARKRGHSAEKRWAKLFEGYSDQHPELAAEFARRVMAVQNGRSVKGELPRSWDKKFNEHAALMQKNGTAVASRIASKQCLDLLAPAIPELLGGSADLTGSVGTLWQGASAITADDFSGRYINYGVREFGMGCVMNGLSLHGGFIPYAGTFLVFADYAKSAIRLSSLMKQRVIWVLTHDSIMVGEDGPTHQPVEQLAMLRQIPGMHVWRPCDSVETAAAWKSAIARKNGPSCLALSRQNLAVAPRDPKSLAAIDRGGYVLKDSKGVPEIIIIATGSEVALALAAAEAIEKKCRKVRVVSMPCAEVFEAQDRDWRESVLPHEVRARVAIEAASPDWWRKYVGVDGRVIGMRTFGESAPGNAVYEYFGFTVEMVLEAVKHVCHDCGLSSECKE
ncbi:transketolase [Desulfovibrio sp. OttesenSCG-928-A18]|nr:transketolase [Desulfovibrio sp. OttesenSCG-928-A18]